MINYVIINGVNSNTKNGLGINELPPITKPSMRTQTEEIDGRDGDIITKLGYSAYDKTITIGLFGTGYDVNDIISFFTSEGTITFSNEPDKYYKFTMLEQIDVESLLRFKTASITFHCQPFKYPTEEEPLEIEYEYVNGEGENITLDNTEDGIRMDIEPKGNTSQTGTPTPDTPIPINVVSGDNEVVVCGKNILNVENPFTQKGSRTINLFLEAGNYTMSISGWASTGANSSSRVEFFDSNDERITYINFNNSEKIKAFALSSNSTYLKIYSNTTDANSGSITVTYNDLMLLKGTYTSETIPPYEPYKSQKYPINLGTLATSFVSGYVDTDGTIASASNWITTSDYIEIKPNTSYTFKANSSSTRCLIGEYEEDKSFKSPRQEIVLGQTYTTRTSKYIKFSVASDSTQILMYETSKPPLELNKIGDYQDYITKNSDGQWCKYNAIKKIVLDGSEDWNSDGGTSGTDYRHNIQVPRLNIPAPINEYYTYLSNYFTATYLGHNIGEMTFYLSNSWLVFNDKNAIISGTENWKTWLTTHNTIVYYVLATPYLTLIEDETLISQLDNLQNAMSYDGQTNISQINNDLPFIISASAMKQNSNEVVVNNIGNATSKPLIALEGTGNINIYLDGTQVLQANVVDKMNIDIDKLEAYNPDTSALLNRQVTGNYNSMTLPSGNSTIKIDGALDKATITNYQRWL